MELKAYTVYLLQFLLLISGVQLQHYYAPPPSAPRQLYYEAPRLRRWEPYALSNYVTPPVAHYQQQMPNFQVLDYRPRYHPLALDYQQQQQQQQQAPAIYSQHSMQYAQRAVAPTAELAKYRYEGNYIPVQQRTPLPQRRLEEQQQYNVPPALFTSDVLHVLPPRSPTANAAPQQGPQVEPQLLQAQPRPRRQAGKFENKSGKAAQAKTPDLTSQQKRRNVKEKKYYHDIFMRFDGPTARSHGHVLSQPKIQERRFETQRGTNRYKGEVIWTDRQGAHGEHRWDLAQGKL
ncbi:basic-leucine zipper transcription factor A [Drosophila busckii]|uniref:basic-leucine zipper transcription factor A n=1 Tax=Drosophila busckii TaxID=30019 RepID=UPI00143289A0|nr:basic-leucine zipper transcription factor A [Drosophila busckii]